MASIFDAFSPSADMTEEERKRAMMQRALLGGGIGMLQASQGGGVGQPDATFTGSLLAGLGGATGGVAGFQDQYESAKETALKRELINLQKQQEELALDTARRKQAFIEANPSLANEAMRRELVGAPSGGAELPASVREFLYFLGLSPEKQKMWMVNKRTPSILNLGGEQGVYDSLTGAISQRFPKTLAPEQMPETKAAQAKASTLGKGEAEFELSFPKVTRSYQNAIVKNERVDKMIDEILPSVNKWSAGKGSLLSVIPATDAANLQNNLNTVLSNLAFDELQSMRDSSPTGGALGQVSERELALLQSMVANISANQSPAQLKRNLMKLKEEIKGSRKRIEDAYAQDVKRFGASAMPKNAGGWSIKKKGE